jgi:hypothetical protein
MFTAIDAYFEIYFDNKTNISIKVSIIKAINAITINILADFLHIKTVEGEIFLNGYICFTTYNFVLILFIWCFSV